jgi:hypothetical protein
MRGMFYKTVNGAPKAIGMRYCLVCERPAVYHERQTKNGKAKNIYLCGYHSPMRGIDRNTEKYLNKLLTNEEGENE